MGRSSGSTMIVFDGPGSVPAGVYGKRTDDTPWRVAPLRLVRYVFVP